MNKFILSIFCICVSFGLHAQNLLGAWEAYVTDENGDKLKTVVIFADGYQVATTFDAASGKFIQTNGGSWKMEGNTLTEKVEFHTENPEAIGSETSTEIKATDMGIELVGRGIIFKRIDNGNPGNLQGAWLMSGRIRDGKTQSRDTNRPRKTMKILSGTRFQWIAYNTETKEFKGTGGGTYTTVDGKYTEHIEFFSRDNSKAGISLTFNYELIDGKWNHSGLSSKGNPIHEIWSIRK